MKKAPCLNAYQATDKELHTTHQRSGCSDYTVFAPDFQGGFSMKQLTSYNRVAGYLNKLFDLLNQRFLKMHLQDRPSPSNLHREHMDTSLCETILGYPSLAAATKSISGPVRSQDPLKTSVQRCFTRWCITIAMSTASRTRAEAIPTTTNASRRLPRVMA